MLYLSHVAPRLLILGWDSATFDVAEPLMQAGELPALKELSARGFSAPLRSTWPPMTDCAWTSAFTGRNPGGHGIFGSWYRAPGEYACRYFSSRDRRAPALWELGDDLRFLVWNVPMTYPPTQVEGAMVAGYGAPPDAQFCDPPGLQQTLADRWPLEDLVDRAPHGSLSAFFVDLLRGMEAQADALIYATKKVSADCLVAVWPHIDRAQHFFWRFRNTDSVLAGAVDAIYKAMDRATGKLIEEFPDADVVIVSDHGAGDLKGDVNVGAWLAHNDRAVYKRRSGSPVSKVAWAMPPRMRKLGKKMMPSLAARAYRSGLQDQLGPFDWARTQAFLGVHGDLWLNLEGREPQGIVPQSDAPALTDELRIGLLELTDPRDGSPLFAGVHARADIYWGPAADLAPDLILDSWSAGYRVAPRRRPSDDVVVPPLPLQGVAEAWSADHRPLGIFVAGGPRIASGRAAELSLYDVCPTALALLERPVPDGLDGTVATDAIAAEFLAAHPVTAAQQSGERSISEGGYSDAEAAAVAAHLKDLGYID
jgi:predicted AlkP superfamily phosphohydrolase/phosphomutase